MPAWSKTWLKWSSEWVFRLKYKNSVQRMFNAFVKCVVAGEPVTSASRGWWITRCGLCRGCYQTTHYGGERTVLYGWTRWGGWEEKQAEAAATLVGIKNTRRSNRICNTQRAGQDLHRQQQQPRTIPQVSVYGVLNCRPLLPAVFINCNRAILLIVFFFQGEPTLWQQSRGKILWKARPSPGLRRLRKRPMWLRIDQCL